MIAKPGPHKEKIVSDQDANYRQIWANADCTEKIQEYYVPGVSAVENKLGGVRLFGSRFRLLRKEPNNNKGWRLVAEGGNLDALKEELTTGSHPPLEPTRSISEALLSSFLAELNVVVFPPGTTDLHSVVLSSMSCIADPIGNDVDGLCENVRDQGSFSRLFIAALLCMPVGWTDKQIFVNSKGEIGVLLPQPIAKHCCKCHKEISRNYKTELRICCTSCQQYSCWICEQKWDNDKTEKCGNVGCAEGCGNVHPFGKPLARSQDGSLKHCVGAPNILFCMYGQLRRPIHDDAREFLLQLRPSSFFQNWLSRSKCEVLPDSTIWIHDALRQLQLRLRDNPFSSHEDLFFIIHPALARMYRALRENLLEHLCIEYQRAMCRMRVRRNQASVNPPTPGVLEVQTVFSRIHRQATLNVQDSVFVEDELSIADMSELYPHFSTPSHMLPAYKWLREFICKDWPVGFRFQLQSTSFPANVERSSFDQHRQIFRAQFRLAEASSSEPTACSVRFGPCYSEHPLCLAEVSAVVGNQLEIRPLKSTNAAAEIATSLFIWNMLRSSTYKDVIVYRRTGTAYMVSQVNRNGTSLKQLMDNPVALDSFGGKFSSLDALLACLNPEAVFSLFVAAAVLQPECSEPADFTVEMAPTDQRMSPSHERGAQRTRSAPAKPLHQIVDMKWMEYRRTLQRAVAFPLSPVFCLDQVLISCINGSLLQRICDWEPYLLTRSWLNDMAQLSELYRSQTGSELSLSLHMTLFSRLGELKMAALKAQQQSTPPTYFCIMSGMPSLQVLVKELELVKSQPFLDRWKSLSGRQLLQNTTSSFSDHSLGPHRALEQLHELYQENPAALSALKPEVFWDLPEWRREHALRKIDFSPLRTDEKAKRTWIWYIREALTRGTLHNFSLRAWPDIGSLLFEIDLRNILKLDISDLSSEIFGNVFSRIASSALALTHLTMRNCAALRVFDAPSTEWFGAPAVLFPQLQELLLDNCPKLEQVQVHAPRLIKLGLCNNTSLTSLTVERHGQLIVDIRGWSQEQLDRMLTQLVNVCAVASLTRARLELPSPLAASVQNKLLLKQMSTNPPAEVAEVAEVADDAIAPNKFLSLVHLVRASTTLRSLHLQRQKISEEGFRAVADVLEGSRNRTLTRLELICTGMKGSARLIFSALKKNVSLIRLNVAMNSIEDTAAMELSAVLSENTTLQALILKENSIGDKGAFALAEGIKKNKSLTELDLSHNHFNFGAANALSDAAIGHSRLCKLALIPLSIPAPEQYYALLQDKQWKLQSKLVQLQSTPTGVTLTAEVALPSGPTSMIDKQRLPTRTLLSIDGGGIRGLIPARVICALENGARLYGSRWRIHELFEAVAGTSIGGILALGLTASVDGVNRLHEPTQFLELFEQHGASIFPRRTLHNMKRLVSVAYSSTGLEDILQQHFGAYGVNLSDALIRTIVTSVKQVNGRPEPYHFDSHVARRSVVEDYPMAVVARATSAAQGYFPLCVANSIGVRLAQENADLAKGIESTAKVAFMDGGNYANNPAQLLCERTHSESEMNPVKLYSLGTGTPPLRELFDGGLLHIAAPTFEMLVQNSMKAVENWLEHEKKRRKGAISEFDFLRLNPKLDKAIDLSETDAKTIEYLNDVAKEPSTTAFNEGRWLSENSARRHKAEFEF